MPRQAVESKSEILANLKREVTNRLAESKSAALLRFMDRFFMTTPELDLQKWRADDLLGSVLSVWEFFQQSQLSGPKVKVFNPDYEQHGWQSTHTVVMVLVPDMSFIVDSLRLELNRQNVATHAITNAVIRVSRDDQGHFLEMSDKSESRESIVCIEIDRHTDKERLENIRQGLLAVLNDVKAVVNDFDSMLSALKKQMAHYEHQGQLNGRPEIKEASAFLVWLENNFTFLGYEEFERVEKETGAHFEIKPASGLGLLRDCDTDCRSELLDVTLQRAPHILLPDLISFSKASVKSRVHRPAYPDYISFRQFDDQGEVCGEVRFLGLYTSSVYTHSPSVIPVVRDKIKAVMDGAGFYPNGHDWKELLQVMETFPRDDLFQTQIDDLSKMALGILQIRERRQIRLFLRRDYQGQYFSALVYVPRDIYSTEFRLKAENILKAELGCDLAEFNTYFSESILARTQFNLRCSKGESVSDVFDVREIEYKIRVAARSWDEDLYDALIEAMGEEQGIHAFNHYGRGFSAGYRSDFSARSAVIDIQHMKGLSTESPIALSFYRAFDREEDEINFKLFHFGHSLPLSDVLPTLENLGLRVIDEHPYQIEDSQDNCIWIHDFNLRFSGKQHASIEELQTIFTDAFLSIWQGISSSDDFNRLVLGAGLNWREVSVLRAYASYMKQIRFPISTEAVSLALNNHVPIARDLIQLFNARLHPQQSNLDLASKIEERVLAALDDVSSLNEDQVIRQYLALINATLRTNYFQMCKGQSKGYLSFKLSPAQVPFVPQPYPMFEIFVFSPRVEGVHLRGGKVARGGLRWSDRNEDFRTEVLGLVKAQQVKNAVIVPVGAKGGFVAKRLNSRMTRDEWLEEGIACYKIFISALLDITDNVIDNEVVPPKDVVRHDEDDTYLVVAADKGTATFSDIANGIAESYQFWLGDAFASGGSQGYDHKKMGITARGAWVSVERHFREIGINTRYQPFTVIGIGDMSGDVFGNGLLLSDQIKLVAAFNHMHIFIDPNPDPQASFVERKRLFELPRSGWMDYQSSLISKGGGVFERSAKSITLTPEIQALTGLTQTRITPTELISALLKSEIDLLWNGGIGTYVKASTETHADVGDKTNDALRVDGNELRCKVVGEGGNLGMTQLGRMEFARNGGRLNTDFIDNAGGVDCSDHEVNIKILLNGLVAAGDLTLKQRNQLLLDMTDEVSGLVLKNNYRQVQAITLAERRSLKAMAEYQRFINKLESEGKLNRKLEFIPTDDQLEERRMSGLGLTRPELSVLVSYSKADLKAELLKTDVPDDAYLARELVTAFPNKMVKIYNEPLKQHKLCREIVATQIANEIVNLMGVNFVDRLVTTTGTDISTVVRSYVLVRDAFDLPNLWKQIEFLDYEVDAAIQLEMMERLQYLVRHAARWFVRNRRAGIDCSSETEYFADSIKSISVTLGNLLCGEPRAEWEEAYQRYTNAGVPSELAKVVAGSGVLFTALGIIEVTRELEVPLSRAAQAFFSLGERLELHWFAGQLNDLHVDSYWQALARDSFRDDLEWQQRALTATVLQVDTEASEVAIDAWIALNKTHLERWDKVLSDLKLAKTQDYAMYTVAVRELFDLARTCKSS